MIRKSVQIVLISAILLSSQCLTEKALEKRADRIHRAVLTLDSHTDTPLEIMRQDFDIGQWHDPNKRGSRVDLPRMEKGGLDAIFFAAYIGQGQRTPEGHRQAYQYIERMIRKIAVSIEENSSVAELALTPEDAYRLEEAGKHAIYIGVENGYALGGDLQNIRKFYSMGVRYITLCHIKNNDICDSSNDSTEHGGLSPFGAEVVEEMNRVGMMIDVSHSSDETFCDVLELSKAPIIASHSSARALCDNPRNLRDAMLQALAQKGGVVQVAAFTEYIKTPKPNPEREAALRALDEKYPNYDQMPQDKQREVLQEWFEINRKFPRKLATVSDYVDHIEHIIEVAGVDHVGVGTDFDGGGALEGLFDVSEIPNITKELVRRGYSEKEIAKVWGGNFMRVFQEANRIARELSSQN